MDINNFEERYLKTTSLEHRKKYAQFFTPIKIADLMSRWLLKNKNLRTVLEPAFGLGVFSRLLLKKNKNLNIRGFEIDKKIFSEAKSIFKQYSLVSIFLKDYMFNDWHNKYDGIICNPPYFKFQDYDNKRILLEVERKLDLKLNGFTNLYALFLIKSIYQLNKNGRAAYIIPSEFLNSDYGKLIKDILIKNRLLRHVIVVNFKENVFDEALTTSSILLFANDINNKKVVFSNVSNLDDLNSIKEIIQNYPNSTTEGSVDFNILDPNIKWKSYYQSQNSKKYKNIVPFSNFGKVMRGIATGSNDYFIFNRSKAKNFSIPTESLLPCITKSAQIKKTFFREDDFKKMVDSDEGVFLFNAKDSKNKKVKEYISLGEKNDVDKKFLTSKRSPWYSIEKRRPAPIWVSVFNRKSLKFVRNEANISNLTTFHCIYPVKEYLFEKEKTDLLFAYLLTDTARQIFEDNGREYGNGLKKFEPNDINKGMILDLNILTNESKNKILNYYNLYRNSVIEEKENRDFIKKINDVLNEVYLEESGTLL